MKYAVWNDMTQAWETAPADEATAQAACATLPDSCFVAGYGGEFFPLFGSDLKRALRIERNREDERAKRAALLASFGMPR